MNNKKEMDILGVKSDQIKQTLDDAINSHKLIQQVIRNLKEKQDITDWYGSTRRA
jgi:hypothetical protein